MSTADFVHEIELRVPRATVHAFLCDLNHLVALHPLIQSIAELPPTADLPRARRYRVVDRIPLGPLRLRTSYVAALDPVSESEIHGYAWQFPAVRLVTVYALHEIEGGTQLVERVTVSAPRVLRRFVVSQASAAHSETLKQLKALLEAA